MSLPRRIVKETQRLTQEPVPGITAIPFEDNMRYFNVIISGPDDSPYEAGVFRLELFLPADYPMAPPKARFLTKIYHPNVDKLGRICLDILKDKWSPALQIRTVLLSIQALLSAPNPDDPLDNGVADAWNRDEAAAQRTAAEWTRMYARAREVSARPRVSRKFVPSPNPAHHVAYPCVSVASNICTRTHPGASRGAYCSLSRVSRIWTLGGARRLRRLRVARAAFLAAPRVARTVARRARDRRPKARTGPP